jgi:arabinogalactan oligomer / maltooligosaccharide transport system permease protein
MNRVAYRLVVVLLLALTGAACGSRREKTVTVWHQMTPAERKTLDAALEKFSTETDAGKKFVSDGYEFRALYYETEQLRQNFMIAALGGSGADLVYGPSDMVGPFTKLQIIHTLDSLPDGVKFEQAFLDSFITEPIKANTYLNGHLYQIADQVGNHLCLVYNKDLIAEPPRTMSELIAFGEKFSRNESGDRRYGLVWNYTEPFFFVPFVGGYGGGVMNEKNEPVLNNDATIKAANLIKDLRDKHQIIPKECDYNVANTLFKDRRAAMIINGPWSWAGYKDAGINFGIAKIPLIDETGLYPAPMVSPRGYSININIKGEKLAAASALLKFLCSPEVELDFTKRAGTIPSRREAFSNPLLQQDEILKGSLMQVSVGKPMPVVSEMRVIWDSMRPSYQAVLSGTMQPDVAAAEMQRLAEKLIAEMKE